jgi:hypothetical protein
MIEESHTSYGIGIGGVLAVIMSWGVNHSILYAILHGVLGWLYVIYWCMNYR